MEMRAATLDENDEGRRIHRQIVSETNMVNVERIERFETELRNEIRQLRLDLQESRDETAKASRCYAEHWRLFHEPKTEVQGEGG